MKQTYQKTVPGICRVGKSSKSIWHGLINVVLAVFLFAAGASSSFAGPLTRPTVSRCSTKTRRGCVSISAPTL